MATGQDVINGVNTAAGNSLFSGAYPEVTSASCSPESFCFIAECNANVRSTDPVPESQNASIFLSCTLFLDCFLHAVEFCRIMKQSTLTQRHQMVCPASK